MTAGDAGADAVEGMPWSAGQSWTFAADDAPDEQVRLSLVRYSETHGAWLALLESTSGQPVKVRGWPEHRVAAVVTIDDMLRVEALEPPEGWSTDWCQDITKWTSTLGQPRGDRRHPLVPRPLVPGATYEFWSIPNWTKTAHVMEYRISSESERVAWGATKSDAYRIEARAWFETPSVSLVTGGRQMGQAGGPVSVAYYAPAIGHVAQWQIPEQAPDVVPGIWTAWPEGWGDGEWRNVALVAMSDQYSPDLDDAAALARAHPEWCAAVPQQPKVTLSLSPPLARMEGPGEFTWTAHVNGTDAPVEWALLDGGANPLGPVGQGRTWTYRLEKPGTYYVQARVGGEWARATVNVDLTITGTFSCPDTADPDLGDLTQCEPVPVMLGRGFGNVSITVEPRGLEDSGCAMLSIQSNQGKCTRWSFGSLGEPIDVDFEFVASHGEEWDLTWSPGLGTGDGTPFTAHWRFWYPWEAREIVHPGIKGCLSQ